MNAQVFYRKWRPQRLDQVVGQEPVMQTLRQAIALGRVAHAYMFCGPRGTGKTSTARILAKAVNCLEPQDGEPCNRCAMCQAFSEGRAMDLIEIDAASHRGIDEMRNLREKILFAPGEARYKVYIIDEVHMLTEPAFNALLKTLEEPPGHAIFVLATTEPHKVPLTIVSRCQRFDFRRISQDTTVKRLEQLCSEEDISAEDQVLLAIARSAGGSLRDAENLLEQLVVSYGSPLRMEQVRSLLGLGDDEQAMELVQCILSNDVQKGLLAINQVAAAGHDLRQLHRGVAEYLRGTMLLKSGAGGSLGYSPETATQLQTLVQNASMEQILMAVKTFGQINMRLDSSSPLPLELALVECATQTHDEKMQQASGMVEANHLAEPRRRKGAEKGEPMKPAPAASGPPSVSASSTPVMRKGPGDGEASKEEATAPTTQGSAEEPYVGVTTGGDTPKGALARLESQWNDLVKSLSRYKGKRFNIGALLRDCKARQVEEERVVLRFSHRSHMERMKEELDDPQSRKVLKDTLTQVLGSPIVEVQVSLVDNGTSLPARGAMQSHLVRAALAMGARIVDEKGEECEQKPDASGPAASGSTG